MIGRPITTNTKPPMIAHSFQPASLTTRLVVWLFPVIHWVGSSSSHTLIVRDLFPTEGAVHVKVTVAFFPARSSVTDHCLTEMVWSWSAPDTTIVRETLSPRAVALLFAFVKLIENLTCWPSSGFDGETVSV